jgi:glycosyltransferase involved in cell wall biosynthesis
MPRPVALVHDFFIQDGGAERCAIELANLLPAATIHTSFFDARVFGGRIDPSRVRTWPLQRLIGPTQHFRSLLPAYPVWFTLHKVPASRLVVSSSVAFSKAVRTNPGALHISYVYTPTRYAWDLDTYLAGSSGGVLAQFGARLVRPALQRWDRVTARRPDVLVAISETVRERISRLWSRESEVIYPPVDVDEIPLSGSDNGYLLVASRMLAYRRLDLIVGAARSLGRQLVVVGDGPEKRRLEAIAGPETTFEGFVSRSRLVDLMSGCSAYVVPGLEDFGIAPVEAMAAGKPVVAFRGGGVMETVVEGSTGVFFDRPTVASLAGAIGELDALRIDPAVCRARAEEFSRVRFIQAWCDLLARNGVDPSLYSAG